MKRADTKINNYISEVISNESQRTSERFFKQSLEQKRIILFLTKSDQSDWVSTQILTGVMFFPAAISPGTYGAARKREGQASSFLLC